ncbi:Uncharacterised protein [Vibrio cholerae]|nr:Uncharacterised protein [Vibrio cholerae]CSI42575.1 Uncharacterised protein [Vibrio cholerae]
MGRLSLSLSQIGDLSEPIEQQIWINIVATLLDPLFILFHSHSQRFCPQHIRGAIRHSNDLPTKLITSLRHKRQVHLDLRPLLKLTLHLNLAIHQFNQVGDNRHT